MKLKALLIFATLLVAVGVYGQTTISYGYTDARGGRTDRSITMLKAGGLSIYDSTAQALKKEFIPAPENIFTDALGENKVSIYPNPTRGELVVQVTNATTEITRKIMLYNMSGELIYQKDDASEYTDVDITFKPAGTYILKIFSGTTSTTWKIIKQ